MNPTTVFEIDTLHTRLAEGVAIVLARRSGAGLKSVREPVTFGVPFPRGAVGEPGAFTLHDGEGRPLPTDAQVLDRWPDGSIRWLLVDAQVDTNENDASELRLRQAPRPVPPRLDVQQQGSRISVDTGRALFVLQPGGASLFEHVHVDNRPVIDASRTAIVARDDRDRLCHVRLETLTIEEKGALRCVVRADGFIRRADGTVVVDLLVRGHFFAGSPTVRLLVRVRNPRRAEHNGGFWDLGDGGSIYLRDVSLTFALAASPDASEILCSPEAGAPFENASTPFGLYQESSGGERWDSPNHINRHRVVPHKLRGYRLQSGNTERHGLRATPIVVLDSKTRALAATLPRFWQNFPKSIEATDRDLVVRLFPAQYPDLHEIQGGEQKTHEVFVSFAPDSVTTEPLAWCRNRLLPRAQAAWYCASGAVPYLTAASNPASQLHLQLVNAAVDGDQTFTHKRETLDQYGWRHFGDIYGDHEAVRHTGPLPLVSHYNNQYDPVWGFACQFLRTGDARWWMQMEELASHVVDIDIYHTTRDKVAYNHGLFWHTYHYGDADTATHRTYPRVSTGKTHGGGPSSEHNYTTGLMTHYFLTGDPTSRDAAVDLGQFVIDIDDGTKTVFKWLDRGYTGLASASGSYAYHGPGRGGGNSLNALVDAFRLTGRRVFLDKAEHLIRRCIHPADDVPARDLLDAERKWFYTMFLQALGKYLDDKAERNELDGMYRYASASLVHYARWMAVHEYPYLEHPERLEFPTETWAAQDIRKSDVFHYAAKHANGPERERFLARGAFFHRYATTVLETMPTRSLARPVIVLLSNGWLHAWFREHPDARAPESAAPLDFSMPEAFVPQKTRAKKRAVVIAVSGLGISLLAATYWVLRVGNLI